MEDKKDMKPRKTRGDRGNKLLWGVCIAAGIFAIIILITMWTMPKNKIVFSDDCTALNAQITQLIDEANHCNVNSDCKAYEEFPCPFKCAKLINVNADLSLLNQGLAKHNQLCFQACNALCIMPPTAQEIACISNKCVDTRYQ